MRDWRPRSVTAPPCTGPSTPYRSWSPREPVTFRRATNAAKVSRSWLYNQSGLGPRSNGAAGRPARSREARDQPATVESLRQQLHAYREEVARLRTENQVLNDQLARLLGAARAAAVTTRS